MTCVGYCAKQEEKVGNEDGSSKTRRRSNLLLMPVQPSANAKRCKQILVEGTLGDISTVELTEKVCEHLRPGRV